MGSFKKRALYFIFGITLGLNFLSIVHASPGDQEAEQLRKAWATIKYQTPKKEVLRKYESLIKTAEGIEQRFPNNPSVLTWYGTILSSYSAEKGGLGALPHIKKARALLEKAIQINGRVENGFANAVLGTIYARVPGWPVAFGNKQKAKSYLETALRMNPRGIDSNYYYGDFLVDEHQYSLAKKHLEIANQASIRKGYEVQDRGRKQEIAQSMAKIKR